MQEVTALRSALDALAGIQALPAEPCLAQARVVRPAVAAVLALPGSVLSAGLDALMRLALSERESAEVTLAWARVACFAHAGQVTTIADWQSARTARVDREVMAGVPERWASRGGPASIGQELALAWGVCPATATARVIAAVYAARHLPVAVDAVAEGRMSPGHLDMLTSLVRDLPAGDEEPRAALRAVVQAQAVRLAPQRTV